MPNLETSYMNLKLKNPIIVGSSGFTKSVDKIVECAEAGAGAVVLKSLFEEALCRDTWEIENSSNVYPEAYDYIAGDLELQYGLGDYCKLIRDAKKAVDIPIIASINCVSDKWWPSFAKRIAEAGADALELNVFSIPSNAKVEPIEIENLYYSILQKVKQDVTIPISLKIGSNFTSIANFAENLYIKGLNGLVLFNRFTEPDIDINKLELRTSFEFTTSSDLNKVLRWIAIIYNDDMEMDLSATTGIHTSEDVIKMILAGASSVQLASVFYKDGLSKIGEILVDLESWMKTNKFETIDLFKGKLSFKNIESPSKYLRAQFLEKIKGYE